MTSRKQKTIRINSDSADITRVPRPSKSTHHNECKPKHKQTKVEVMSEKPSNTEKTSKGIIARKKKYTWKISSVHKYIVDFVRRLDLKKYHSKLGLYFKAVMIFKTRSASIASIIQSPRKHRITSQSTASAKRLIQPKIHNFRVSLLQVPDSLKSIWNQTNDNQLVTWNRQWTSRRLENRPTRATKDKLLQKTV